MDRPTILGMYHVDKHGVIRSPGRFEGERLYVPYFWDAYLNGLADSDDGRILEFRLKSEDRRDFPELKGRRTVRLYQRDDGFVCEC